MLGCIGIFVALPACQTGSIIEKNKSYKAEAIVNPGIAICLSQLFTIENPDDVKDDLGDGNPKDVYLTFFKRQLPIALAQHSTIRKTIFLAPRINLEYDTNYVLTTHAIGRRGLISMYEPKPTSRITVGDSTIRFILFIEKLNISRAQVMGSMSVGAGHNQTSVTTRTDVLAHKFNFVVWDMQAKKSVNYGSIEANDEIGLTMTKRDWETILESAVKEIVTGTPFEK